MPEIVPGGDFGAGLGRLRVLWPVVHQWLGVSPHLGRGRVAVVPQLPPHQGEASARGIRLGDELRIGVGAKREGKTYSTEVRRRGEVRLTVGAVVPLGSEQPFRAPQWRGGRGRPGAERPVPATRTRGR